MNLIKWNPMREMELFSNHMNSLFGSGLMHPRRSEESGMSDWSPMVDIFEKDNKIVIKAELPGISRDDISVDVSDGVLTLSGERSYENEVNEGSFYRKERAYGKFQRSFALPEGLDPDKIDADFSDGVLNVEIPRPEEKKPKKIDVH